MRRCLLDYVCPLIGKQQRRRRRRLVPRGILVGRLLVQFVLLVARDEERLGDACALLAADDLRLREERPRHGLPVDEDRAGVRDVLHCGSGSGSCYCCLCG